MNDYMKPYIRCEIDKGYVDRGLRLDVDSNYYNPENTIVWNMCNRQAMINDEMDSLKHLLSACLTSAYHLKRLPDTEKLSKIKEINHVRFEADMLSSKIKSLNSELIHFLSAS